MSIPSSRRSNPDKHAAREPGDVDKFLQTVRAASGVAEAWATDGNKVFVKLNNFQIICLPDLNMESLRAELKNMGGMRARSNSDASHSARRERPQEYYRERTHSDASSLIKQNGRLHHHDNEHMKLSDSALNDKRLTAPNTLTNHDSRASEIFNSRSNGMVDIKTSMDNVQTLRQMKGNSKSLSRLPTHMDMPTFESYPSSSIRDLYRKAKDELLLPPPVAGSKGLSRSPPKTRGHDAPQNYLTDDYFKHDDHYNVKSFGQENKRKQRLAERRSSSIELPACSANLMEYRRRRSCDSGQVGITPRDIKNMKMLANGNVRRKSTPLLSRISGSKGDLSPKLWRKQKGETLASKDVNSGTKEVPTHFSISPELSPDGTPGSPVLHLVFPSISSGSEMESLPEHLEETPQDHEYIIVEGRPHAERNLENSLDENFEHSSNSESDEDSDDNSNTSNTSSVLDLFRRFFPGKLRGKSKRKSREKNQKLSRRMSMDSLLTSGPPPRDKPEEKWKRVIKITQTGDSQAFCIRGADTLGGLPDCDNLFVHNFSRHEHPIKHHYHRRMSCPIIFEDDEIDNSDASISTRGLGSGLSQVDGLPVLSVSAPPEEIHHEFTIEGEQTDQRSLKSRERNPVTLGDNDDSPSQLCGVTFIVQKRGSVPKVHSPVTLINNPSPAANGRSISSHSTSEPERDCQQLQNGAGVRRHISPPKRKMYKTRRERAANSRAPPVMTHRLTTGHVTHTRASSLADERPTPAMSIRRPRSGTSSTLSLSSCEEESESSKYLTDVSSSAHTDSELSLSMER